jgi:RNA polymerase sigma-70 factor (ECF subfamily)
MPPLAHDLAARLHRRANADRWGVSVADFAVALERSAARACADDAPGLERALAALHLEDLALACACARGDDAAWEHFVHQFRPALYRAASAMAGDNGRELADSLYADLFGLQERDGARQSLFRYFHGRSSLATWLRAVLAQRHIDGVRSQRRLEPLPEEDDPSAAAATTATVDGEAHEQAARVREALGRATARLTPRDRLRLAWYYGQGMTLAQIGRLCQEHEATVSRHLSRTRRSLREDVETQLRALGLGPAAIDECFAAAAADPGDANLADLIGQDDARKISAGARSRSEEPS